MIGIDFPSVPRLRILLLVAGALLGGCGQRGPLVLPGPDADPIAAEAATEDDSDESADDEGETSSE